MMAVTPAFTASSTVSGIGKNASDDITEPLAFSPACSIAILAAPTRFICPAPTPIVILSFASTIALDFTCFTTFHANNNCSISSAVGLRFVTQRNSSSLIFLSSISCTSNPSFTFVNLYVVSTGSVVSNVIKRMFFFFDKISNASASKLGAMMISKKMFASFSATALLTGSLNATIPPKIETGSASYALSHASSIVSPMPTPHGFMCFNPTAAGFPSKSFRISIAALPS